jgi:hypothetical protein
MFNKCKHFVSKEWLSGCHGAAQVIALDESLRLTLGPSGGDQYINSQLDDYHGLRRQDFRWHPPLTFRVRARFSHSADQLRGTAGFGFWNDPFMLTEQRLPTLPRAIWFFFTSLDSNIKLAQETTGFGWKAATIDAWQWLFLLLAPAAPLALPLIRINRFYRWLWPIAQKAIGVREAPIVVEMTDWHIYRLEWGVDEACFWVDDHLLLKCLRSPRGPLGLVLWIDNQSMLMTPWNLPRRRLVAVNCEQWMELQWIEIAI